VSETGANTSLRVQQTGAEIERLLADSGCTMVVTAALSRPGITVDISDNLRAGGVQLSIAIIPIQAPDGDPPRADA